MGTYEIAQEAIADYEYEQSQPNPLPRLTDSQIRVELSYANQDWHKYAVLYHDYISDTRSALIDAWFNEQPFPALVEEQVYDWGRAWLDENQYDILPD